MTQDANGALYNELITAKLESYARTSDVKATLEEKLESYTRQDELHSFIDEYIKEQISRYKAKFRKYAIIAGAFPISVFLLYWFVLDERWTDYFDPLWFVEEIIEEEVASYELAEMVNQKIEDKDIPRMLSDLISSEEILVDEDRRNHAPKIDFCSHTNGSQKPSFAIPDFTAWHAKRTNIRINLESEDYLFRFATVSLTYDGWPLYR
ncbi:MAG: hypothetical protein AAGF13_07335, partial [Pseudomonadota bacterium]